MNKEAGSDQVSDEVPSGNDEIRRFGILVCTLMPQKAREVEAWVKSVAEATGSVGHLDWSWMGDRAQVRHYNTKIRVGALERERVIAYVLAEQAKNPEKFDSVISSSSAKPTVKEKKPAETAPRRALAWV